VVIAISAITFVAWMILVRLPRFVRAHRRGGGAHHCLPMCARFGDADVDHGGRGRGAQNGVLIRDAEALERMEKVDTLVVDKTGTLTEGRPRVVLVAPANDFDAATVMQKLASVERASEHPLAAAIVADAQERKLTLSPVTDFDSPPGKGVIGLVDGSKVVCGSAGSWRSMASMRARSRPMRRPSA